MVELARVAYLRLLQMGTWCHALPTGIEIQFVPPAAVLEQDQHLQEATTLPGRSTWGDKR